MNRNEVGREGFDSTFKRYYSNHLSQVLFEFRISPSSNTTASAFGQGPGQITSLFTAFRYLHAHAELTRVQCGGGPPQHECHVRGFTSNTNSMDKLYPQT